MEQDASNHSNRKIRQEVILLDDTGTTAQDPICLDDEDASESDDKQPEMVGQAPDFAFDEDASDESDDSELDGFDEDASDDESEEDEGSSDGFDEDASDDEPEEAKIEQPPPPPPPNKRARVSGNALHTMLTANGSVSTTQPSSVVEIHQPVNEAGLNAAAASGQEPSEASTNQPASLPDCFYPYLTSLPDGQRVACEKATKVLVRLIDKDVSATTLLELVKQAEPEYGLSFIIDGINKIRATARKKLQCYLTVHAKNDTQAYLGQLFLCLLICADSAPVKDQLIFLEWDVVLAAKLSLDAIKSKCAARAPDFVYASTGNDVSEKNDLVKVLAWALQERPGLRIVIESKEGPDNPKRLQAKDLEDKLGIRFFPLDIPVDDGGAPVLTSFLISDRDLYNSLCALNYETKQSSFNPHHIAQNIALYVNCGCELYTPREGPPKRLMKNELDSSTRLQNDDTHKFRKSYDEPCTYPDVKLMLEYRVDLWPDEVKAAWDACQSTFGTQTTLNNVREKALEVKRTGAYTQNSEDWQPQIRSDSEPGSKVRKFFGMEYFVGEVVGEDTIDFYGEQEKVWCVKYEDGDTEKLHYCQLLQLRQNRHRVPYAVIGRPFRFCELFCGSGVVTDYFSRKLFEVMSIDVSIKTNATHVMDIKELQFDPIDSRVTEHLGGVPDFIWASPPCQTYSKASGDCHRIPRTEDWNKSADSRAADFVLMQVLYFMQAVKKVNPHLIIVIENPVAYLDKVPIMTMMKEDLGLVTASVNYCAFGRDEPKSTHLWTNDDELCRRLSKYTCQNCCPISGRKHKGGVQKRKGMCHDLCHEVIPEPLALFVARYAAARLEKDNIRHYL